MLSANMIEKGQGKAYTAHHVSSSQNINVQTAESDALKTTSPDIGTGSQDDVFIDSDIYAVADMGVQTAMEFLTADKVIVSHEDADDEKNKEDIIDHLEGNEGESKVKSDPFVQIKEESMPDPDKEKEEEKDDKEIIREQDVIKLEEPANEENISDVIPKKKRARLSRLDQRPSRPMTEVGSPSKAPSKLIYALPLGPADEPPKETLEEFREWIKKGVLKRTSPGKRPPRYNAKYETLDKPHDLGFTAHIGVAFYYLRKKIRQFPKLEQRKVTMVDTFFSAKVGALWSVYQKAPENFDWGSRDSILRIMLGVHVQSGSSWFEVNTLLILIHLADLKHWALVKLDLTNWTIEMYDSLQHEGPHNFKVREGVECMSKFIPLLAERLSLFEFKPREPPGIYPIPVTIMKDIPQQANGGDCEIFTIKNAKCLIEGRDVRYWVIHERMQIFKEWLTCYLWCHAKRKIEQNYKSDDDVDMNF
ncbi:hypothetical protein TIFTF001_014304 [Ficus carica]|uniref:Ubiquitin-like protease family profile domain-containing protein n=1 Tax=Ficus carica TaxID=3494 RepID=A0AA87ZZ94_FICCA|nr:hypothetical protein TIFTF001_014304 [Ficus carica]